MLQRNFIHKLFVILVIVVTSYSCSEDNPIHLESDYIETHTEGTSYSFLVAGHVYGTPGAGTWGIHPPLQSQLETINKDDTITMAFFTGDLVFSANEQSWDSVDAHLDVLHQEKYIAPGNHDWAVDLFTSRYGDSYKSFVYNDDLFIILNPNIDSWKITGDQLVFLKKTISENSDLVSNIFVFFHQVLWWSNDNIFKNIVVNSTCCRASEINFWTEVEPLFSSIPNKVFMFAGDVGANNAATPYMYYSYDNITLIASGMGSNKNDNIIVMDVLNDTVIPRIIALQGDQDRFEPLAETPLP